MGVQYEFATSNYELEGRSSGFLPVICGKFILLTWLRMQHMPRLLTELKAATSLISLWEQVHIFSYYTDNVHFKGFNNYFFLKRSTLNTQALSSLFVVDCCRLFKFLSLGGEVFVISERKGGWVSQPKKLLEAFPQPNTIGRKVLHHPMFCLIACYCLCSEIRSFWWLHFDVGPPICPH